MVRIHWLPRSGAGWLRASQSVHRFGHRAPNREASHPSTRLSHQSRQRYPPGQDDERHITALVAVSTESETSIENARQLTLYAFTGIHGTSMRRQPWSTISTCTTLGTHPLTSRLPGTISTANGVHNGKHQSHLKVERNSRKHQTNWSICNIGIIAVSKGTISTVVYSAMMLVHALQ
jgi:hypothetical protein